MRSTNCRRGVSFLSAQVRRAGMQPEWTPEAVADHRAVTRAGRRTDRLVTLGKTLPSGSTAKISMTWRFNLPESRAETDGARARDLVSAAKRRDKLDALTSLCRKLRPGGGFSGLQQSLVPRGI